jgi:hypothetical protein
MSSSSVVLCLDCASVSNLCDRHRLDESSTDADDETSPVAVVVVPVVIALALSSRSWTRAQVSFQSEGKGQ